MPGDLEHLDFLTDPSLVTDPYPYYDAIRECPVRRDQYHDVTLVSGYDEAVSVYRDEKETFSICNVVSGPFSGFPKVADVDDVGELIEQYRGEMPLHEYFASWDPPKHTDHRSLLNRLLTPKRMRENEEFLWGLADRTIDGFVESGRFEFVTAFGNPFTMLAIADLLGVPESDRHRFARAPELVGDIEGADGNYIGVKEEWFVEYVEERRRRPRADVLTQLAEATFPDGTVPEPIDVARVAVFLFAAGQGTTVDLLSAALLTLAEDPELQQRLRDDRSLVPRFVEEMLRLESPVKSNFRLARRSTDVDGTSVSAGTHVMLLVGAANRDPRHFDEPHELRLDRPNLNEHVAFGRGIHSCPGASLARVEARVSLERMLDRLGDIRIDETAHGPAGAHQYDWEPTWLLRRLKALHLEFKPIEQT